MSGARGPWELRLQRGDGAKTMYSSDSLEDIKEFCEMKLGDGNRRSD